MRSILVTGGTGFIGKHLCRRLADSKHQITILTRNPNPDTALEGVSYVRSLEQLDAGVQLDAIINLAGEPLAGGRWNRRRKQEFVDSRLSTTRAVTTLIERLERKPGVLLSGSAIGWYGPHGDEPLSELGQPVPCFSHQLCAAWEAEALAAHKQGVRVCLLRIGVVLGRDGGALGELARSHQFGVNAVLGDGTQFVSWIHIEDLLGLLTYLLTHDALEGVVNCTAPHPVSQEDFSAALAVRLRTWIKLRMPGGILRALLGEMADEMVLTGQRVVPQKLLSAGFEFKYPSVQHALENLMP